MSVSFKAMPAQMLPVKQIAVMPVAPAKQKVKPQVVQKPVVVQNLDAAKQAAKQKFVKLVIDASAHTFVKLHNILGNEVNYNAEYCHSHNGQLAEGATAFQIPIDLVRDKEGNWDVVFSKDTVVLCRAQKVVKENTKFSFETAKLTPVQKSFVSVVFKKVVELCNMKEHFSDALVLHYLEPDVTKDFTKFKILQSVVIEVSSKFFDQVAAL
jgi:hypothetical protein